jgi:hypothetical protein
MLGLEPGIHAFAVTRQNSVDGRDKPGYEAA